MRSNFQNFEGLQSGAQFGPPFRIGKSFYLFENIEWKYRKLLCALMMQASHLMSDLIWKSVRVSAADAAERSLQQSARRSHALQSPLLILCALCLSHGFGMPRVSHRDESFPRHSAAHQHTAPFIGPIMRSSYYWRSIWPIQSAFKSAIHCGFPSNV